MRAIFLAGLCSALLSLGCFALDELDKGNKELDRYSRSRKQEEAKKAAAQAKPAAGTAQEDQHDPSQWWNEARSINRRKKDSDLVQCRLGGSSQFMRKTDCLSRGGRVSG